MSAVTITVIYALPGSATEIELSLPAGTTVAEALNRSGIASRHPEVDLARCPVGIFGRRVERGRILSASRSIVRSSPSRGTRAGDARMEAATVERGVENAMKSA